MVGAQLAGLENEPLGQFPQGVRIDLFGGSAQSTPQRSGAVDGEGAGGHGGGDRGIPWQSEGHQLGGLAPSDLAHRFEHLLRAGESLSGRQPGEEVSIGSFGAVAPRRLGER